MFLVVFQDRGKPCFAPSVAATATTIQASDLAAERVMVYVFGDYRLDPQRYELHQADRFVKLRLKVFHILTHLLAHRDRVVSKEELCEQL